MIGRGEVISALTTDDGRRLPRRPLRARPRSSSRPPATSSTTAIEELAASAAATDRAATRTHLAPAPAPVEPRGAFHEKETEQYHICLGGPGITRNDERRFALSVLDAVLGGSTSSRLFQEVREKRGLAYSVYSWASQYRDTGQVGVYVGTREDNVAKALEVIGTELDAAAARSRSATRS